MFRRLGGLIRENYQQVLFVFLAFLAMVLVSYFYVSSIVREQMFVIGEETMNTTQTAVSSSLAETELVFANLTQRVEAMLDAEQDNEEILAFLVESHDDLTALGSLLPDFMKVYAYIRGEFLDGSGWVPPDDYVATQRPWHIGAVLSGHSIYFTEPYLDADTGTMCISFSQVVADRNGKVYGVVAIDLNLNRITDYVGTQQIANDGYGVLLNDTLHFTTHRDGELVGAHINDAGGEYPQLAAMIRAGQPIAAQRFVDADGTDSIAFFRSIFYGWHIGVIIPRASYYRPVYQLGLVLSLLGFVMMASLSYLLIRTRAEKLRSDAASRSKSEFLSRMSHEMRTPMNAIIGMTAIAKKSDDQGQVQDCLAKIDDASAHLLGVINDVLDMSKIEAGMLELSPIDFSLEQMLEQVVTVVNFKMEEKSQDFKIDVASDVPQAIVADRQRLAQVITNLLINASKFTPEGGHISLSISLLEPGDAERDPLLRFEVADDGIGISQEQQSRLFRAFEQADGSISRKFGGTGLGLAISKSIVHLMGGQISVQSSLGEGSRFIFTIRAGVGSAQTVERAQAPPPDSAAPLFQGKRILLAEDVEINREILIELLSDTGVVIECAENGQEAADMFRAAEGAYDLIFMDIHMPEVDGYQATRQIRAMEDLPRAATVPIVAMTANVFREDIEKCLAAGMNAHVSKPFQMDAILAAMTQYMLTQP